MRGGLSSISIIDDPSDGRGLETRLVLTWTIVFGVMLKVCINIVTHKPINACF